MNQHEKHLRDLLHHADTETVEQIGTEFPAADDAAKERIYQNILNARQTQHSADMIREEEIPIVRHSRYRNVWAAAACLLICGGIIGTAAIHRPETYTENVGTASLSDNPNAIRETEETAYSPQETHAAAQQETNASLKIQPETTAAFPLETTIVTVIADEPMQTEAQPEQETQAAETSVQQVFTAILPETALIQTVTETIPAETQAAESAPQNTFAFIPLADQMPDVSGFTFTAFESEWGQKCSFAMSDTANRKYAVQERYEASYLPEGWEYHSTNDPNGSYESDTAQGIQWYVYETFYEMTAADNGELLTDFYLIVRQHAKEQELLCKQEYVLGANGMQVPENPSLYAYAETTVNGNPAFIYREDHPSVGDTRSIWYTLYWEQDGYLFSIFTGDVPESYLPELIRTAESVQMIK